MFLTPKETGRYVAFLTSILEYPLCLNIHIYFGDACMYRFYREIGFTIKGDTKWFPVVLKKRKTVGLQEIEFLPQKQCISE